MLPLARTSIAVAIISCALAVVARPAQAQPPASAPTTAVLVNLTLKPDVDRAQLAKVMPDEVRDTVKLYLDGKIQQWFGRSDGRGVLFILNATSVADAKAIMDDLPLSKAHLNVLEFTPLGPLTPLRALIAPPPAGPAKNE